MSKYKSRTLEVETREPGGTSELFGLVAGSRPRAHDRCLLTYPAIFIFSPPGRLPSTSRQALWCGHRSQNGRVLPKVSRSIEEIVTKRREPETGAAKSRKAAKPRPRLAAQLSAQAAVVTWLPRITRRAASPGIQTPRRSSPTPASVRPSSPPLAAFSPTLRPGRVYPSQFA